MIDANKRTNLKYLKYQEPIKPSRTVIMADIISMSMNKTLDKKFISLSSKPIFDLGILEFI
jgi:hypothetical protein